MTPSVKRIVLATEPDGGFLSGGQSWLTVDVELVARLVRLAGYATMVVRVDELLDFTFEHGDLLFYTSAFNPELRAFIREVIYFAGQRVPIAPAYDLLLAHENKGVQEILRKRLGFGELEGHYHVDFDEQRLALPYVFKTTTGAGSQGVHLIRSAADERRIKRRYFGLDFVRRLKQIQRHIKLPKEHFRRYSYYYKPFRPFVAQEFIPGLDGDFKILVLGDRFYTLSRENRPGDFRASGSGRLDFDRPCPAHVLDFARNIFERLVTPYLSLDIADSSDGPRLIEMQALNFGPSTLTGSSGYYRQIDGEWQRISEHPQLDHAFAHAIVTHIQKRRAA